jgi:hypothetical protein
MRIKSFPLFCGTAALLALSACSWSVDDYLDTSQYWQRSEASSATYTRGPKAQQMLKEDIANCVFEMRELERLGGVRESIPTDKDGRVLDPPELEAERKRIEQELEDWDTPERKGQLYAEHSDYHDFEGCMLAKGLERTKFVPYEVDKLSKDQYLASHIGYQRHKDEYEESVRTNNDNFSDLNE